MNGKQTMMYRVPMPTKSNGVKIKMLGDHEIGVEYTEGEPVVGKMAYDSAYGITSKITFRRARPDFDRIVADAVRQVARDDTMPKAGKPPIRSKDMAKTDTTMEYDDDASKVIGQLMDYLEKYLDPDQMEAVSLILSSGDAPDNDAGERQTQATDRRRVARLAADQARRRPMTAEAEDAYLRLFPNAQRLA
jgi:hypothetical protein